ncbi:MAG: RNA-guided endonuclease IscB [Candidatus Thermoplasmatota archaeon]|nr:RNA-guided endonuclease IscB [Candidatus Thermoplasmatota archaeon]
MKEKQKLDRRNTYTPADAPQVRSNCGHALNNPETDSVHDLKTPSNNPDVDTLQPAGGHKADMPVFILNDDGKPLMPCKPAKARHLLRERKAKMFSTNPFTIQLLWHCEENVEPVTLGIDAGYKHIGFSAVTEKAELISGEAIIRTDIPKQNLEKAMYRRNRRNRLWYRQARFMNRGNHKEGWFAPSIDHKLQTHIRIIEKLKSILPISRTIIEVASFDTQKMRNPEISGIEYQQGDLQGYEIREYLLEKFHRKCVYCGKTNVPLEIEHLTPKSRGGSNMVSNLAISCHECNQKKNNLTAEEFGFPEVRGKSLKTLKDTAFMNIVRWKITQLTGSDYTFGHITKKTRISMGMEKSHANDAFVIAGGANQVRTPQHMVTQRRRNNRSLQTNRKGFKPSIRRKRYSFQPGDVVAFNHSRFSVVGVHNYGKYVIIRKGDQKTDANVKKVKLVKYGRGIQFAPQFLPTLAHGVSLGIVR